MKAACRICLASPLLRQGVEQITQRDDARYSASSLGALSKPSARCPHKFMRCFQNFTYRPHHIFPIRLYPHYWRRCAFDPVCRFWLTPRKLAQLQNRQRFARSWAGSTESRHTGQFEVGDITPRSIGARLCTSNIQQRMLVNQYHDQFCSPNR